MARLACVGRCGTSFAQRRLDPVSFFLQIHFEGMYVRGFYPGVRQQAVQIDYRLKIPGMPDFQQIDAFMSLLLGEDYVETTRPAGAAIATPEIPVRYAHRVLHLASGLLRLGQIPVFADRGSLHCVLTLSVKAATS